jgi:hypothetical protein
VGAVPEEVAEFPLRVRGRPQVGEGQVVGRPALLDDRPARRRRHLRGAG